MRSVIGAGPIDSPDVRPLFDEPDAADAVWHRKTGLYPISQMLVVKNAALGSNPDLAGELFETFNMARVLHLGKLRPGDAAAPEDRPLHQMVDVSGEDPIPYSVESSRKTLETFVGFNVEQKVVPERVDAGELFPAATLVLG